MNHLILSEVPKFPLLFCNLLFLDYVVTSFEGFPYEIHTGATLSIGSWSEVP